MSTLAIEFVIAGDEHVRTDEIRQLDNVRALIETRHQGGREGIPRMAEQYGDAARPLRLDDGRQLREAPRPCSSPMR